MTLRVCQLITELDPGGAERVVYDLATGLDPARFARTVVSLTPATGDVAGWLRERDVPVLSVDVRHKADIGAVKRLAAILRDLDVQILHTHLAHANILGRVAGKRARVPVVLSTAHVVERRFMPWRTWADRLTSGRVDAVVCVSEAVRSHVGRECRIPAHKLTVIHNGVDATRFDAASSSDTRRELGADEGDFLIVSLGRLRRQKGHDVAIRAMAILRDLVPHARLAVVGDGPEHGALLAEVARLGLEDRVTLAGQRDDVPGILASAQCLVAASRYEGFGLAAAEAMAAHLPVVASDVDSLPELVEDGVSGLLVEPEDAGSLARAVKRVYDEPEPARARAAAARERVTASFTLGNMLDAHASLYRTLARSKGVEG